jgi:hypothetical protein
MDAKASVKSHVLLDVREDSFERIAGVGNVQLWMSEVCEKIWKISLHAVVGTPQPAMRVVPLAREFIDCSFLEERSPLVMPESQPERELRFTDMRKRSHEGLYVLARVELWPSRYVPCDDGCLMEVAHLHRYGKALQDATSAITHNGHHLPSGNFQCLNSVLVRSDGFVGEELPEKILFAVRTPPHHDAEQALEVRRVHDDDHLIGRELFLLNLNAFQLSLHPLRTATVVLRNLHMGLFAMCKLMPNFPPSRG